MITGSCLCEKVRWQVDGPLVDDMTHCHCSMCRKAHAAAFGTYVDAPADAFSWVAGEDAIVKYQSSPGLTRAFCGDCGSVVPDPSGGKNVTMAAGSLNGDPGIRPIAHIFAPSKAPWHEITDDLPQFDGYPDPEGKPNVAQPAQGKAKDDVLRGSCLCGDVAYEVRAPIKVVHHCHCSRCRKARAAAHATNGFTKVDGVVFVRGEEKLKTYKLPTAKFFTQVFCTRCGSGMPRLDTERGIAVIPLGSLDDDPGRGADDHIFTGSMAAWDVITDDLPCFEEMP